MVGQERKDPDRTVRLYARAPREGCTTTTHPSLQFLAAGPTRELGDHHQGSDHVTYGVPSVSHPPPSTIQILILLRVPRIDDVEDNSILRRGIPVAHNIFGTAQTINSANYVYFLALQEVQQLNNPLAMDIYVKEMLNLHRGQGMDLFWRDTLTCPTEDEYLEMVGNKTGGLFRLAVKLMQAESKTGKDCVALVNVMGLIFQICDDYLNLSNTVYTQNKGLCEDLTEGKFSFPIIHSIRSNPSNHQLLNILKQKTKDDEVKRYAVQYMQSTGSFGHARQVVSDLRDKALGLIEAIDKTPRVNGAGMDRWCVLLWIRLLSRRCRILVRIDVIGWGWLCWIYRVPCHALQFGCIAMRLRRYDSCYYTIHLEWSRVRGCSRV